MLNAHRMAITSRALPSCLLIVATGQLGCAGDLRDPQRFQDAIAASGDAGKAEGGRDAGATAVDAACSPTSAKNVPKDVFISTCTSSGCHNPTDLAGFLDLQSSGVASRLVGVQSHDGPGVYVSADGDPAKSDLYLLLTPAFPFDNQMPLGRTFLDAPTLACVRAWIADQATRADAGAEGGGA